MVTASRPTPTQIGAGGARTKPLELEKARKRERVDLALPKGTWLARGALVALSLSACKGVYDFACWYDQGKSPVLDLWSVKLNPFALITALAFEATYIGIACLQDLSPVRYKLARKIAIGAVTVSVSYNVTAGLTARLEHLKNPDIWSIGLEFLLSLLHGVPLAVIAYYLSDLLLHPDNLMAHQNQEQDAGPETLPQATGNQNQGQSQQLPTPAPVPNAPVVPEPAQVVSQVPTPAPEPIPWPKRVEVSPEPEPKPASVPPVPANAETGTGHRLPADILALLPVASQFSHVPAPTSTPAATLTLVKTKTEEAETEGGTVTDRTTRLEVLRGMIIRGQHINRAQMAIQFGITAAMVRKDLAKLAEEGYTEGQPQLELDSAPRSTSTTPELSTYPL